MMTMAAKVAKTKLHKPSTMTQPLRYLTSSTKFKERSPIMPKRTGQMTKPNYFSGPFSSTAKERESHHKSWIRTIGLRLLISFQAVMTHSVSTNSTRTRNLQSKSAIGSRERMKNL